MDPERLGELFEAALACSHGEARDAFLRRSTEGDSALLAELESLLEAHDQLGDFLETSAVAEAAELLPAALGSNLIGSHMGNWRVDALIHAGGMGSVFRATRIEADFTQSGALKLVRVGFETEELLSRFSRERQLLAGVEHPHIARLLDGGTTSDGLPWLAMELVDGLPIDVYADHHCLDFKQRLDLFDQLADAIAYLHQNLITHRDIKVSNVLVDTNGHVRVLDFGIASLLDDASAQGEATAERRLSLATAAPEQLQGKAISTATDVYALGAMLYRLLTGVLPYRIHSSMSAAEIETLICDIDPPRASSAVLGSEAADELAAKRQSTARRLAATLAGDLDTILAKSLAKDPLRRYRSVAELRADIERYRTDRPIAARPDSVAYRSSKFLRRHWQGLCATIAVIGALSIGLGLALWQADEAGRQRDRAQAMNEFMQEVLAEADPYEAGVDKLVRDVLAEASALLGSRFIGKPLLEASLRETVGGVQLSLVDLAASEVNLQRARTLLATHAPRDDQMRLQVDTHLAWLAFEREEYDASIAAYEEVLSRLHPRRHSVGFRAGVYNDLGLVLGEVERFDEAIAHHKTAMQLDPDNPERVSTLINLGYAYDGRGQLEEASAAYLQAIARLRAQGAQGKGSDLAHALNNYGNVLSQQNRDDEALPLYLESLQIREQAAGKDSDSAGSQHLNIGRLLLDMQRPVDARPHLARAEEILGRYRAADSIFIRVARMSHARSILLTAPTDQERDAAIETLRSVHAALQADPALRSSRFVGQAGEWLADAVLLKTNS